MDDIDRAMQKYREIEEQKHLAIIDKCASKITDNDLIYRMCALKIMQRFELQLRWDGEAPYICYEILNYYIEEVDEDFEAWLYSDNAPLVRPLSHLRRIFPELILHNDITDREIIDLVNKVYGIDLRLDDDYIYSYSFNFNAFKPIPAQEVHKIKEEIAILLKYDVDTSALEAQIESYGLPEEVTRWL